MKRLLVISFNVPPTKGPSPGRAFHLVRHLPKHDWEAVVLTPRHPSRHSSVEKTREHRDYPIPIRQVIEPSGTLFWLQESTYKDLLFSFRQPAALKELGPALPGLYGKQAIDPEAVALEEPPKPRNAWQRMIASFRCNPDARAGWVLPGLHAAHAVCDALKPDAVYSISPPVTSHRIAMRVAANLKIPWIADLREPWQTGAPGMVDSWRRAKILRGAKAFQLPPSFDPADLGGFEPRTPTSSEPITLIHAGPTAKRGRDPMILLDAIRHMLDAGEIDQSDLRVRCIGARDPRLVAGIAARSLSSIVTLEHEVPWQVSLEMQAEASALLLAVGPGDVQRIPDRLTEAFAVRKRVIAFGPADWALQDLIRNTGIGTVSADSSALAGTLADIVRQMPPPEINDEAIDPYRAERVVEGLVKLLGS